MGNLRTRSKSVVNYGKDPTNPKSETNVKVDLSPINNLVHVLIEKIENGDNRVINELRCLSEKLDLIHNDLHELNSRPIHSEYVIRDKDDSAEKTKFSHNGFIPSVNLEGFESRISELSSMKKKRNIKDVLNRVKELDK